MTTMNPEQLKGTLRMLIATFGGLIAGWFAAKGWFTVDQVLSFMNSEVFIGVAVSIAVWILDLFVHKESNAVAVVGKIADEPSSPVKGVITTATPEGVALAKATPSTTVVSAGTVEATAVASRSAAKAA